MTEPTRNALILAGSITLAGLLVGGGLAKVKESDRFVTVKGVAEREARADLAIWPLRLVAADDDLTRAYTTLRSNTGKVRDFLARNRIAASDVGLQEFGVVDNATNYGGERSGARYVIRQTILVRSTSPDDIVAASQRIAELVSAGVVFSSGGEYGSGGPTFVFTGLNKLKPPMIAEATSRAREAAEQFARDSRTDLGGIRRANQGVFEILPRDQASGISEESQIVKTVRVVATVEYLLKD